MGMNTADQLAAGGVMGVTHRRGGGVIAHFEVRNTVTDQGLNALLDAAFSGAAAGPWFLGLRGNGLQAAGDTLAVKGWSEFTSYAGERKAWVHGPAALGRIVSSTAASFDITGGEGIIRGGFLAEGQDKGSLGRLFMVVGWPRALILYAGDSVDLTYDLSVRRA